MTVQIAAINGQNEYLEILDEAWQQHLEPCTDNAPTVISIFAGCGGSSLGYSMAGFREQWARIGNSVPPLFMRSIAWHIRHGILEATQWVDQPN